jgi:hypothetical protein
MDPKKILKFVPAYQELVREKRKKILVYITFHSKLLSMQSEQPFNP